MIGSLCGDGGGDKMRVGSGGSVLERRFNLGFFRSAGDGGTAVVPLRLRGLGFVGGAVRLGWFGGRGGGLVRGAGMGGVSMSIGS